MTQQVPEGMLAFPVATQAELDAAIAAEVTARNAAITAGNVKLAGDVVQVVSTQTGAVATGTTTIPFDDSIPQITEGTEFMTRTITPSSATSVLLIEVVANFNASAVNYITGALFQDAVANALAAATVYQEGAGRAQNLQFSHSMVAGTTSPITFRFRAGPGGAATLTFNGESGARRLGGVMASSIRVTEIKA